MRILKRMFILDVSYIVKDLTASAYTGETSFHRLSIADGLGLNSLGPCQGRELDKPSGLRRG